MSSGHADISTVLRVSGISDLPPGERCRRGSRRGCEQLSGLQELTGRLCGSQSEGLELKDLPE